MGNQWTEQQFAAIHAKNKNVLVSAAAGSGKTAVLVERIIKKITDTENPVDIDRLLVVTFTNAAAAEMRERIANAIASALEAHPDSKILARQLVLIHKANITTIHSFCHDVIRTNFNLADIDPNFRIADVTEDAILRMESLEEVMDELYEDETFAESFAQLLDSYSNVKNHTSFQELILKIYAFVLSLPNPKEWLNQAWENFYLPGNLSFDQTDWAKSLTDDGKKVLKQQFHRYQEIIDKAAIDDGLEKAYHFLKAEAAQLEPLLNMVEYSDMYQALHQITFATFPSGPRNAQPIYRDYIKNVRNDIKSSVQDLQNNLFHLSAQEQKEVMLELSPLMRCLSEVVLRLMERFQEKKLAKNLLNFNDLEHACFKLFRDEHNKPTVLAQETARKYDEILIDEYQDTSKLQEAIFSAIHRDNNLFMVGDMKQSIYRFRNTDPLLFRHKKESFLDDENAHERKIILSKNFRSRSEVLSSINFMFERIMTKEVGEIDYDHEEMLYAGLTYPDTPNPLPTDTELNIIDTAGQGDENQVKLKSIEAEALLAAQKIQELITAQYQVFTKSGYKNISYKDICILLRSTKENARIFSEILSEHGIPVFADSGGGFLASQEIDVMLSFLKVIDNPYQDIPLLAVLRSALYRLTTNDLAAIRIKMPKSSFYEALVSKSEDQDELAGKLQHILSELTEFREKARYMKLDELIWDIYSQTGFYDSQGVLAGGLLRQSNLRILAIRAAEYEKTGFKGLYRFIQFIDSYQTMGGDYEAARMIGEEQDIVRIMSIHKSKGLEFPVVLLCGIGKKMNKQDLNKSILLHPIYGYGPKFIHPELRISYPNGIQTKIRTVMEQETVSEEMRILYVALTRAREKLILIGSISNVYKRCADLGMGLDRNKSIEGYKTMTALHYLDWFLMALLQHPDSEPLRAQIPYQLPLLDNPSKWMIDIVDIADLTASIQPFEQREHLADHTTEATKLLALSSFVYPHREDTALPTKLTVTELKSKLYGQEEENTVYLYPKPLFLSEPKSKLQAVDRGIALHTVMETLDFSKTLTTAQITEHIAHLTTRGVLTEEEGASVCAEKILHFSQSEVGQMLRDADEVRREFLFGIHLKAKDLGLGYESKSPIMLQGVIDCLIIKDNRITILDYKTDKVNTIDQLVEKYRIQLDYYQIAAEKILKQKVVDKILYLFAIDEAVFL